MSIEPVTTLGDTGQPFKKGLAIIVGNEPDGILVHVADLLGNDIQLLDEMEKDYIKYIIDDIIYLIGHGISKSQTIDGQDMEYIAKKLYNAGYRGKQILYITSCEAKAVYKGKSIYNLLCKQLEIEGASIQNVQSDFDGLSIIISDSNYKVEAWNIKTNPIAYAIKQKEQKLFLKRKHYQNVDININTEVLKAVNEFKIGLIQDFGGNIMSPYYGHGWWKQCAVLGVVVGGGVSLCSGLLLIWGVLHQLGIMLIPKVICEYSGIMSLMFSILTFIAVITKFRPLEMLTSLAAGIFGLISLNSLILCLFLCCGISSNIIFGIEQIIVGIVCIIVLVVLYH